MPECFFLNPPQLAPKNGFDISKYNALKESVVKTETELQEIKHLL